MSDIARWAAFDGGIAPHPYGKWILFDDHQAEVERLKNAIDHLTSERDEARGEVERLTRMTVADFALAAYRKRWPR